MAEMNNWLIPGAMLLIALLSPLLAWWGSSQYLKGVLTSQKEASDEWRRVTGHRLDAIETTLRESSFAVLKERIDRMERDLQGVHDWKHRVVDPYLPRAVDEHDRQINALNRRVFGVGRGADSPGP